MSEIKGILSFFMELEADSGRADSGFFASETKLTHKTTEIEGHEVKRYIELIRNDSLFTHINVTTSALQR